MGRAKEIIVKVIPAKIANEFVVRHHYSKKFVQNSQVHFGAFLDGKLHGVMQYGASMDKAKVSRAVIGTGWNEFIELNRMAFDDYLPKNSESRCISVSIKLLKKHAPHIKWIVSFADATQCGDGAIYRASGFHLVGIKKNQQILNWKGKLIAKKTLDNTNYPKINGKYYSRYLIEKGDAVPLSGFQLKYIYLIDKKCKLEKPALDYSIIDKLNAGMYRGKNITISHRRGEHDGNASAFHAEEGGSTPTSSLKFPEHGDA